MCAAITPVSNCSHFALNYDQHYLSMSLSNIMGGVGVVNFCCHHSQASVGSNSAPCPGTGIFFFSQEELLRLRMTGAIPSVSHTFPCCGPQGSSTTFASKGIIHVKIWVQWLVCSEVLNNLWNRKGVNYQNAKSPCKKTVVCLLFIELIHTLEPVEEMGNGRSLLNLDEILHESCLVFAVSPTL
jgi:hypothetical protein